MVIIVEPNPDAAVALRDAAGESAQVLTDLPALEVYLAQHPAVDVTVLGPGISAPAATTFAESVRLSRPALCIVLAHSAPDQQLLTDALRSGIREVVPADDFPGLQQAVLRALALARSIRDQSAAPAADEIALGRVVTVFSAKGGAGKTTLSTNLGAALADGGRRSVCILDLDLQFGDVAIALQLFPARTIADAVSLMGSLDEAAVAQLLTPHSPGLTTLVAPVEPHLVEIVPGALVGKLLTILRTMFDVVVVDTPPAFTDHVLAAFDESDYVALLATLDIPSLKNLKLTLETLDQLNFPRDKWRIVLNRADSKVGLALSEVEKTLRFPISAMIPSSRDVPASVNRGVPIVLEFPTHPVSLAIKAFGEQHIALPAGTRVGSRAVPANMRTDKRRLFTRRRAED